ncbi:MAG: TlyA family RNA methyltransferase [Armatimonadaceae bacterium]
MQAGSGKQTRQRLDLYLVETGQAATRSQAQTLIREGRVQINGVPVTRQGIAVDPRDVISLSEPPRYVSRGGEKLAAFLTEFALSLHGHTVLDIGASTGGFTDCALQHGAVHVTCVDVGQGQLHPRLQADSRVINREKVNIRHLQPGDLPHREYDTLVMDLSFISLRLALPPAWRFLVPGGRLIALIKPQFEAGKAVVEQSKGVVRDLAIREAVREEITRFALTELPNSCLIGTMLSPVVGGDGNREYLLGLQRLATTSSDLPAEIPV